MGRVVSLDDPTDYTRVISTIRRLWREGAVTYRDHFFERLAERGLDMNDVRRVILEGTIPPHGHNLERGAWVWRVEGKSVEGKPIRIPVSIRGRLIMISAIRITRRAR